MMDGYRVSGCLKPLRLKIETAEIVFGIYGGPSHNLKLAVYLQSVFNQNIAYNINNIRRPAINRSPIASALIRCHYLF